MTDEEHRHLMDGVEDAITVLMYLYVSFAMMLVVALLCRKIGG